MTEPERTKNFIYTDPRSFDGDPYQVAERAVQQAQALVTLAAQAVTDAEIMARNAELERDIDAVWDESPQDKRYGDIMDDLERSHTTLGRLAQAAAFNPKARLPRE